MTVPETAMSHTTSPSSLPSPTRTRSQSPPAQPHSHAGQYLPASPPNSDLPSQPSHDEYYARLESLIHAQATTIARLEARVLALEYSASHHNHHHHHSPYSQYSAYAHSSYTNSHRDSTHPQPYPHVQHTSSYNSRHERSSSPGSDHTTTSSAHLVGLGIMGEPLSPVPMSTLNNGSYACSAPPPPAPRLRIRRISRDPPTPSYDDEGLDYGYETATPSERSLNADAATENMPEAPQPPNVWYGMEGGLGGRTNAEYVLERNATEQIRAWTEQVEGGRVAPLDGGVTTKGGKVVRGNTNRWTTRRRTRAKKRMLMWSGQQR